MSSGGLVASIIMLTIGLAWLALPFVRRGLAQQDAQAREKSRERLTLAAAYERALLTVRDLDEDYQVGKLSEEAYTVERERWVERGTTLLELLEQSDEKPEKKARKARPAPAAAGDADDPVEQAIAAYMQAREKAHES